MGGGPRLDATRIYEHAKAGGAVYQAHLRAAVRERLQWASWGPVRKGMAELEQVPVEVRDEFSTRRIGRSSSASGSWSRPASRSGMAAASGSPTTPARPSNRSMSATGAVRSGRAQPSTGSGEAELGELAQLRGGPGGGAGQRARFGGRVVLAGRVDRPREHVR